MSEENIDNTSIIWKQIADMWNNYFAPPSRISNEEIKNYRNWLEKANENKESKKALVLGATPEIRDILKECNYEVTIIDINTEMILAMTSLLKTKNPDEIFVKANWLDNPLADNYFDVVVGDAILPNIPLKDRTRLLLKINRLLKSDGIFITRAFYIPDKKPFRSVEEILEHFSKKEPNIQSALEMVLELHILTYDSDDHLGSFAKSKEALEDYHKRKGYEFENKNLQKIHDIVWNFWCVKFVDKVFVYEYRENEEKEYKQYFEINDIFEAKDHDYSKITPMYFLEKIQ